MLLPAPAGVILYEITEIKAIAASPRTRGGDPTCNLLQ